VLDVLNTLSKGGPVMVPLAVCSMLALTVLIERVLVLKQAGRGGADLIASIRRALRSGDGAEALAECERVDGPVGAVLATGLRAHLLGEPVSRAMEEQALSEQPILQRRMVVLDTVITLAPLLGLLGTVLGMIDSFKIISVSGTSHPAGITGGVAEALIATATGLAIAIFCLVGYNWCKDRIREITDEIELRATQMENLLANGQDRNRQAREEIAVAH
jgi:biopolymer transport protein ExbB